MMSLKHGFSILRESWSVLRQDSQLLWFPVMSFCAAVAVIATIVGSGFLIPTFGQWVLGVMDGWTDAGEFGLPQVAALLLLFVLFALEYFVVIYFNSALVGYALMRYEGGEPRMSDAFRLANERLPQIIGWTLVAAGVGTLLSAIEDRLSFVGKIVVNLVGVAWAIATYFVVPILVWEGLGPIASIKRSAELLKNSWGEGLTGNMTLGAVMFVLTLGVLAIGGVLAFVLDVFATPAAAFVFIGILVVLLIMVSILNSALSQVFLAGLYRFAATGEVAQGFTENSFRNAIKQK